MICKNCNKEMGNNAAFCPECGAKAEQEASTQEVNSSAVQPNENTNAEGAVKKKSKGKIIAIILIIVVLIVLLMSCFGGGSENSAANIEEMFYSTSEGYNVAKYVYNKEFSYEEIDDNLYEINVSGRVELGYLGSGAYENTTLTFELDTETVTCTFIDSTVIGWDNLLLQYQYNSPY